MNIQIATPISTLCNKPENVNKIAEVSDYFELRDSSPNINSELPKIFHSELNLVSEWKDGEFQDFLDRAKNNNVRLFATFHLLSCCHSPILEDGLFVPGDTKYSKKQMSINAKNNIKKVRSIFCEQFELGIENINYYPTGAYEYVADSDFINQIVRDSDLRLLLDLAHARITAYYKKVPFEHYISTLDKERIIQIHLSGGKFENGRYRDKHDILCKQDWKLFEVVLSGATNLKYVTIEYYRDVDILAKMIQNLRKIIEKYL